MAENRDVQRVFVNTRVRLVVTCKGEVVLISRSTAGLLVSLLQAVSLFACLSLLSVGYKRRNEMCWFSWKLHFNFSFFFPAKLHTPLFSQRNNKKTHCSVGSSVFTLELNWTVAEPRILQ